MKHFKWTLIMSMLTLIFLIPAHGAKAANGPAEGEGGYAYIGFADYENEIKYVYCAPHVGTAESVAGASYDKASNTLTLNEYSGTTFRIVTNMMGDDFKIRLIGKNHVQQLAVWGDGWGGCVEFVGDGSLYVNEKKLFMDAVILMPEYSKACIKTSGNAVLYCYAPNGGRPLRVSAAMTNRADEVVVGKGSLSVDIEDAYHAAEKQVSVITQFSDFKTTYAVYKKEGSEKKYAVSTGTLNDKEAYFISEILECEGLETSPFIYEIKSVYGAFDAAKEGLTETAETAEVYDVWQWGPQSLYKERATGKSCIFAATSENGKTVYQKYYLSTPLEVMYDDNEPSSSFCAGIKDKGATYANLGEINQAGYDVVESRTKIEGCYTLFVDGTFYTLQSEEKTCNHLFTTQEVQKKAGFDTDGILLKKCREQGKKVILATSKPQIYAKQILKHFELAEYFDDIQGSSMDGSKIHKEDVIQSALSDNQITDMQEVLMIGDRKHDVLGSGKFGISCVGVLYGYGSREELETCGAKWIVDTVEDLEAFLERI